MERTTAVYETDIGRTMSIEDYKNLKKDQEDQPVKAWLTCIKGKEKGRDYPVYKGITTMGTGEGADIRVYAEGIVKDALLILTYDYKKNVFLIRQEKGDNIAYVNEELMISSITLNPYDKIEIEAVEYIFVPFCEENRRWE